MKNFLRSIAPPFLIGLYHFLWAFFGALLYCFPARNMQVIGVTGTNGKSTTVEMISCILREAHFAACSLSSLRFQIKEKEWKNTTKMTMPGRFVIQRFLRQARNAGCTHAVIEITSEGILQHRHRFLNVHTAVLTNLSPEHIERHGSFENYRAAKGTLFQAAKKVHVINVDDNNAAYFLQFAAKKIIRYSLADAKDTPDFRLKLLGEFNMYNALAAIRVGESLGISPAICTQALERIEGIPGRMEQVVSHPFRVFVDYAFTPAALEKVYKTVKLEVSVAGTSSVAKSHIQHSRLICILGAAGGGRDKWKRPVLGKLAGTYCDKVIVTNEDPYEENPMDIIEQVANGAESINLHEENTAESAVYKIVDRRDAIAKALSLANPGDTVMITGKGAEDSIAVKGGKKIPWDDRAVVKEEFQSLTLAS